MSPILIYGPTASGKSSLAIKLARQYNAAILNADAIQVYSHWQILSARPSADELSEAPHYLYGHIQPDAPYSAGAWLREVQTFLEQRQDPIIIVGGTGLYFLALTQGLAEIPETPETIRAEGNRLRESGGAKIFLDALKTLDPNILARIDQNNPMRLQRAWEVVTATGKPLSEWQAETPEPLISPDSADLICLNAEPDWQRARIDARFETMVEIGALQECEAAMARGWNPDLPSSQAIGAAQLIAHLKGETSLDAAIDASKIATHQYAKRQRTWAKNRMKSWAWQNSDDPNLFENVLSQIENSAPKRSVN